MYFIDLITFKIINIFKRTRRVTGFGKGLKILSQRIPIGLMKQMNFSSIVLTWILVRGIYLSSQLFINTKVTFKNLI